MDALQLRQQCAEEISARHGYFTDRPWLYEAFLAVPRERFVPERCWWPRRGEDGLYPLLDRGVRPRQWLKAVYRPQAALITQIAGGRVRPDQPTACSEFTSSLSCTAVVVQMLHACDPQPGERILEIGTGTGYNAALLAHRVGTGSVVTVEVDRQLAAQAEVTLRSVLGEMVPEVVCADGAGGHPQKAPYDRLLSTVGVYAVPTPWLEQVRPGGVIVTPIATPYGTDALARLVCDGRGAAEGDLVGPVSFMKLHGRRGKVTWPADGERAWRSYRLMVGPKRQEVRIVDFGDGG